MPTALIATALRDETASIVAHLDLQDELEHHRGTLYPNGSLSGPGDWNVVVVQTGKGNVKAALEVSRAIDFVDPSVALFVGIAGGVKDVRVGDVVVGDKVYYTESGKVAPASDGGDAVFQPRPEADRGDYRMLQLAESVERNAQWKEAVLGNAYELAPLVDAKMEVGPIAAGEKVVAAKGSEQFRLVKAHYGDSVAVEMEGHGFGLAAYATGATPGLVIRGISDMIERKTASDETGSQPAAAARAAAFAFALLRRYHVPGAPAPRRASPEALRTGSEAFDWQTLREVGAGLYPDGPRQRSLWERAGGDPAQLPQRDDGRTAWFEALKLVRQGGGGANLSVQSLVMEMRADFGSHPELVAFRV